MGLDNYTKEERRALNVKYETKRVKKVLEASNNGKCWWVYTFLTQTKLLGTNTR